MIGGAGTDAFARFLDALPDPPPPARPPAPLRQAPAAPTSHAHFPHLSAQQGGRPGSIPYTGAGSLYLPTRLESPPRNTPPHQLPYSSQYQLGKPLYAKNALGDGGKFSGHPPGNSYGQGLPGNYGGSGSYQK